MKTRSAFKTLVECTPETIEEIINVAELETIAKGQPAFSPEYREELRRELLAIYEGELAVEDPIDEPGSIPPWEPFPVAFYDEKHRADRPIDAEEIEFFKDFDSDCPIKKAKCRIRGHARVCRFFPDV